MMTFKEWEIFEEALLKARIEVVKLVKDLEDLERIAEEERWVEEEGIIQNFKGRPKSHS